MQDRPVMVIFPSCPHCGKHDVAFYLSSFRTIPNTNGAIYFFTCGSCFEGVCGKSSDHFTYNPHDLRFHHFNRFYPEPNEVDAPNYTPDSVASDYIEAKTSLQHGNIKAACIMAGNAIETALIEHGATGGGLKDKIDSLAKAYVITPSLAEWAHEIKGIRNEAAHHAERGTTPEKKDAEDAVQFAEMLFLYLYTLPGMVADRRKKAQERT